MDEIYLVMKGNHEIDCVESAWLYEGQAEAEAKRLDDEHGKEYGWAGVYYVEPVPFHSA